mmetsp:Transcript_31966/g.39198  ORF Transcript_31966/g.39198 Transcript_31966/m.39198 type:complete len:216 (+) Transcript_31966:60-707(+)
MSTSLRRSQRGKSPAIFNEGDLVEIVRSKGVATGRLLQKLDDHDLSNIRWLVTFDDEDTSDEEISEKIFGRLVKSTSSKSRRGRNRSHKNSSGSSSGSSGKRDEKRVLFVDNVAPSKRKTGRRPRVVTNSEPEMKADITNDVPAEKSAASGGNGVSTRLSRREKRKATTLRAGAQCPKQKKVYKRKEDFVKVKLRTGTLYLYRGENPRAEFVRYF